MTVIEDCRHDWQPYGRHGKMVCSKCLKVVQHVHRWESYPGMPTCIVRCKECGDVAYFSRSVV